MVERHSSKLVTLVQIQKEIFLIKILVGRAYCANAYTAAQKTKKKVLKMVAGVLWKRIHTLILARWLR